MLDRIIASIAIALVEYLARRVERGKFAIDATPDPDRLHRAGARIREWMLANGAGVGGKPGQGGTPV